MAARTPRNTGKASASFFGEATAKPKGRNGRPADLAVATLLSDALSEGHESFSIPVEKVEKVGTVTQYHSTYNGTAVTVTYNKVKGWAEKNGRKLVANRGFYLNEDGNRLTIATVNA